MLEQTMFNFDMHATLKDEMEEISNISSDDIYESFEAYLPILTMMSQSSSKYKIFAIATLHELQYVNQYISITQQFNIDDIETLNADTTLAMLDQTESFYAKISSLSTSLSILQMICPVDDVLDFHLDNFKYELDYEQNKFNLEYTNLNPQANKVCHDLQPTQGFADFKAEKNQSESLDDIFGFTFNEDLLFSFK